MSFGNPFHPGFRGGFGGGGGPGGPPFGMGGGPRMGWRGGGGGPMRGRGGMFGPGGGGGGGWGQFDEDVDFGQSGGGGPVFGDGGAAFQQQRGGPDGGGGRGGGGGFGPWQMNPADVMAWLDHQHPFVLKRIHFHAKWLMQQHGIEPDEEDDGGGDDCGEEDGVEGGAQDTSGWYEEQAKPQPVPKPGGNNKSRHPGFGSGQQKSGVGVSGPLQWTPSGWVPKDNSHKVTTTARPLPAPEMVPPKSKTYPEADADREKLKMLRSNVGMMQFELNKICKRFKIIALNRDDLSMYPEDQRGRLKVAIGCVAAAEKTLKEFTEFLKTDKYKAWNEDQQTAREEKVKQMIGETPTGMPHKRKAEDGQGTAPPKVAANASTIAFKPGGNLTI